MAPPLVRTMPEGDDRERLTSADCGHIACEDPKVVMGSMAAAPGKPTLPCQRAIEPRPAFRTLPVGFLELHETVAEGPAREACREQGAAPTPALFNPTHDPRGGHPLPHGAPA